ncbi:MAG: tRNA (N(6)-L-threonylcarbamoyladenosine(37)-C(2))-methylthiotransferase MtaB [Lachnospiraceae bacterium]|nr:tRNA (N(6)-L-threonylcarbamoyladenosine(37)-C(2))-methylthiotransferase MtaB [Lachnospiraceae bacterium]
MRRKAALHNLGCKVNAYETESMRQMLEQAGYEIVPFEEQADVYVINTCSVTNIADRKSRQMIHRAKKRNPDSVVVAAGCYVQTSEEQARADEAIDLLIGNNKKHELAELLEHFWEEEKRGRYEKESSVEDIAQNQEYEELKVTGTGEHTRAFIKIQDGCNQFCSYCIIPYARGRVRSRKPEDVLWEVRTLAQNGYREIVLTGIHLSSYGVDFKPQEQSQEKDVNLLSLIRQVHEVEGIDRIRFGSLEPKIITEEFVKGLSELPKICPHFHLSLQSGCDDTLKRMNRKYTCEEYRAGCNLIRRYFSHPAITTDVIVGFPGETPEEFEVTRKFLKEIRFFEIHIFKYSMRKGTPAAQRKDQIPEEIKSARSDVLFEDLAEMNQEYLNWYREKEIEILMEEIVSFGEKKYFLGHTKEYVKAAILLPEGEEPDWENKLLKGRVVSLLKEHILLAERC